MVLIAAIGALALATIPIALGWRRSFSDAAMARALGIAAPARKRFDLETWALQTGTNLKPSQPSSACSSGPSAASWPAS